MTNWKEYKVEEICSKVTSGGTPNTRKDEYYGGNIPWVRTQEVNFNRLYDTEIKITEEGLNNSSAKWIPENSIIIAMYGATAGKVAVNKIPVTTNQACCNLIIDKEKADYRFIYYNILSRFASIANMAVGGAQQNLNAGMIKDLVINLPDLPTQTAIAEILSSLDDKIELNNKLNQELENLAQTLFKQWFIDFEFPNENGKPYKSSGGELVDSELGEIPKGWEVGVLEDLIDFSNGNAFKSNELLNEDIGDCYHVFKMGHIKKGGGLNADGTKSFYEKSKAKRLEKYVLKVGDLLMCMTDMKGNVALLGHTALMNENDKYIVNQRVGLLRPKNDLGIDFPYLYILTNSNDFIEDLRSRANSGVQVNLSTSEIKASKVLLPPKGINIEFDNCVKAFFESIFNNTKENQELTHLRDTLLPKLISGELEINNVNI
jgi:type I restriction enzyme S subunit